MSDRHLDPREARPLTSREISKVIGSVLMPMADRDEQGAKIALLTAAWLYANEEHEAPPLEDGNVEQRAFVYVFSGLCNGFIAGDWCPRQNLAQALKFWLDHFDRVREEAGRGRD